jgi:hypothetical protein
MVYLIDPKTVKCQGRCKPVCQIYAVPCPLDIAHPLYGIPT